VAKDREHDRSVDRLLKATPRSALPESLSPACLDAATIASWAEAALGPDEASRVEAHLAECQRCQAVLAAFVRAEPPAASAAPVWRRWAAVLLPIAAATAAVTMWIAWPQRQPPVAPVAIVAEAPQVPEAPPQPAPVPARPAAISSKAGGTLPLVVPPPPARQAPTVSAQAAARPIAGGASPLTDMRLAPSARVASAVGANEPIVEFDSPAAAGGAGGAPPAVASGSRGAAARPTSLREAATLTSAVTRWRILASRDLERSTDDGRTWELVPIDPPSSLTGGAAPSPLVCWLVGRAGEVLVTNDAGHFTRRAFPETVDLSAVQATDALHATVTTADGRTLVTTDGGRTWTGKGRLTPHENGLRPTKPQTPQKP